MKRFLVIVGARPNFIKAAPLFRRVKEYPDIDLTLLHTGQHFDHNMSRVFFDQMGIPKPDIQLELPEGKFSEKLGKLFSLLKQEVENGEYEGVIVFGDINSTLAGAIAAVTNGKRLIHIESGLRSHDRRMPEELNRVITDHLADLLFVTEASGVENLKAENIAEEKIALVGNIMVESIEIFREVFDTSTVLNDLQLTSKQYLVATIHRIENTSDQSILKKILETLATVGKKYEVVFPLHPSTRNYIHDYGFDKLLDRLTIIEPVGYIDFMKLVMEAKGVVTDSGGIQEETSYLGVPCCTLRDNTERPITLTNGTNKLFPIDTLETASILQHLETVNTTVPKIQFWDGEVSKRILELL